LVDIRQKLLNLLQDYLNQYINLTTQPQILFKVAHSSNVLFVGPVTHCTHLKTALKEWVLERLWFDVHIDHLKNMQ